MAVTDWIQTAAVIYFAWQQNRIFKQQNQIFADQAGHAAMSKTSQTPWIARYWPTAVMVGLMGLTGYDIYARHGAPPAVPWWFYVLLLLVVVIVGLVIGRFATTKAKQSEQELINPGSASKPVTVDLVPWQGKGDKMFLTVTNRGTEQQAFQGQCRILARRNDPNVAQLIAFDLQWEYGGQSYRLLPGQSGNLLIARADYTEHHDWEWLQLEAAVGSTKPLRSDWAHGDKLPEYDVEITILGDKSTEPRRQKFTVRAGKERAIEMGDLGAAPEEAPIEKPKEPSKLVIHLANYRAVEGGGEEFQVGDFLRQSISGDSLVFDIENHNFVIGDKNFVPRDPLPFKEKRLQVNYSYRGQAARTTERLEHGRLLLPEDSKIQWLMGEVARLQAAQPAQPGLSPLQIEALQLSGELLAFLKQLGPPPAPKYTAHEFHNMPASQMKALIEAKDGDFLEACEYYRPGDTAFTRQRLENQITGRWMRLLPWYQKLEAAYTLKGFKEKVETLRNRFLLDGITDEVLLMPIEGKYGEQRIRNIAAKIWELAYKIGEKGTA